MRGIPFFDAFLHGYDSQLVRYAFVNVISQQLSVDEGRRMARIYLQMRPCISGTGFVCSLVGLSVTI